MTHSKTFKVPNISCGHCVHTVQSEISDLDNISQVVAVADTQLVTVEWEDPQKWDNIETLLKEINYPPEG